MKKSRIASPIAAVESPTIRSLPLVELLVDTKTELFELMVRSGLQVLDAMLEEDRTALCGPRYVRQATRNASRAGTVPSEVVPGGRKVTVARPRVRAAGREVPLPTFQTLAQEAPLHRRVVEQMLVGVATRQYARSLEPVPAGVVSRGTSKSRVSRRFVAKTTVQLRAWQSAPLDGLDLVAPLVDGVPHPGQAVLHAQEPDQGHDLRRGLMRRGPRCLLTHGARAVLVSAHRRRAAAQPLTRLHHWAMTVHARRGAAGAATGTINRETSAA